MTDSTWPADDTWSFAEDESLESFVRSWVKEHTKAQVPIETVRVTTRFFPVALRNAMEYIRHTARVEAYDREGDAYWRQPSYSEIYVGTALCGLRAVEGFELSAPSRLQLLESGDTLSTLRRVYLFYADGILPAHYQRFDCRLPKRLVGRATDLADALSMHTTTIITALFVAGVARSEEWLLTPGALRSGWVRRCTDSISQFIHYVSSSRGFR